MPRYTEADARAAVATSLSYAEALRRLGLRPVGGNHRLFRKYVDEIWRIPTDHFDPWANTRRNLNHVNRIPLEEVLVEGSTYKRAALKLRLFKEGLKRPVCEMCGQDETWNGRRLALILDHVNGVPDDNRLENLRIVCPNCAATLDTHCGRKNKVPPVERECRRCGKPFVVKRPGHRYCSRYCGMRAKQPGLKPKLRKVERPPYEQLLREIEETSYLAVGRRYGVSDNAVRKWVRQYERERGGEDNADDGCGQD
jgi:hypothetical protein